MKVSLDGSFYLEEGEFIPFICPRDEWPIEYTNEMDKEIERLNREKNENMLLRCPKCGYIGTLKEFSPKIEKV